jgi:predicted NBD/HSP70 family sugar kinase
MAAARAEARFGVGAGRSPFNHVVVGTGASACLVVGSEPYVGSRGFALVVNALDTELVVLRGGLGREPSFHERVSAAVHPLIAYPRASPLETVGSALRADTGIVGAALAVSGADGR